MLTNADLSYFVIAQAARVRSQDLVPRLFAHCPDHAQRVPSVVIDLEAKRYCCIGCADEGSVVACEEDSE